MDEKPVITTTNWYDRSTPPDGKTGKWSDPVLIATNLGRYCVLSFFRGKQEGVWQRLYDFEPGEHVVMWSPLPEVCFSLLPGSNQVSYGHKQRSRPL